MDSTMTWTFGSSCRLSTFDVLLPYLPLRQPEPGSMSNDDIQIPRYCIDCLPTDVGTKSPGQR